MIRHTYPSDIEKSEKMAVPKSKITKSKRNMRRAHDALSSDAYVEDKVTGELHRPHHIDLKNRHVCRQAGFKGQRSHLGVASGELYWTIFFMGWYGHELQWMVKAQSMALAR